jgi:hypothetical protein
MSASVHGSLVHSPDSVLVAPFSVLPDLIRARAMTRPTNERAQDAPPDVHHGQYSLPVIESFFHPCQARKNQVQRWQLSLRAGAYR